VPSITRSFNSLWCWLENFFLSLELIRELGKKKITAVRQFFFSMQCTDLISLFHFFYSALALRFEHVCVCLLKAMHWRELFNEKINDNAGGEWENIIFFIQLYNCIYIKHYFLFIFYRFEKKKLYNILPHCYYLHQWKTLSYIYK
jgi:hypothetical protein